MENCQSGACCSSGPKGPAGPSAVDFDEASNAALDDGSYIGEDGDTGPGVSPGVTQLVTDMTYVIKELTAVWPDGVPKDGIIVNAQEIMSASYKAEREDTERGYRLEVLDRHHEHRENMLDAVQGLVISIGAATESDDDDPEPAKEDAPADDHSGTCSAAANKTDESAAS